MSGAAEPRPAARSGAKTLPLHVNFAWTAAGNIAYVLGQWGMVVAIAKLTTPFMLGQFALGLAICAPALTLSNLQLRSVQASDARREYSFAEYLGLRVATVLAALVFIGLFVLLTGQTQSTALVILAIAAAKGVEALSDIYYGLFQLNERLDRIGQSMMVKSIISIAALGGALYFTRDIVWGVLALGASWLLLLLLFDVRRSSPFLPAQRQQIPSFALEAMRPRFDAQRQWPLARLALPLGIMMALVSVNLHMPRYFVQFYRGEEQLGLFSALAYMTVGVVTIADALGLAAIPRMSVLYAQGQFRKFSRLLLNLLGGAVLVGAAGLLAALVAGEGILRLAYGAEYAADAELFVWLMAAGAVAAVASVLTAAITSARAFRIQVPVFGAVCAANALTCWWLIPVLGLKGGAAGFLVASVVNVLLAGCVLLYLLSPLRSGQAAGDRAPLARPEIDS